MTSRSQAYAVAVLAGLAFAARAPAAFAEEQSCPQLKAADIDKDGSIDLNEAKKAASALFDKLDTDKDGSLTAKELQGRLSKAELAAGDPDKDKTLTKDEFLAIVEARFKGAAVSVLGRGVISIVASLIREGIQVHAFNLRSVAGILDMIRVVGAIVGKPEEGARLVDQLASGLESIKAHARALQRRPRVYFEEWDDPMISGIGWVSELVEAAGGVDVFRDHAKAKSAKDRIVSAGEVVAAAPDIIVGSWCGKRFRPERVCGRPGFENIPAVRDGALHEIKSPIILQPGPAALTDGACAIAGIIRSWSEGSH